MLCSLRPRLLCLPVLFLCACILPVRSATAELTAEQQKSVEAVAEMLKEAGGSYREKEYDRCGEQITAAMKQIHALLESGNQDIYDALSPHFNRIARAHALLELEGVRLPPFIRPDAPSDMQTASADSSTPVPKPTPTPEPAPAAGPGAVSFTKDVAPILISHCGRCHIERSQGGLSLASFADLMKGSRAGVIVFAGDLVGSQLIETIETGDMPRGGSTVPPKQFQTLKDWVMQGAKFDGPSPTAPLASYATALPANTATPAEPAELETARPTGEETVSFARDVAPLLVANCNGCHVEADQTRGGLRMDTFAQLLRGGDSGAIVTPGDGDGSLLVRKLRGQAGDIMPAGGRPALPDESIQLISTWISEGATLDGASEDQPLRTMAALAWAREASHEELVARRKQNAEENWKLAATAAARDQAVQTETENFFVIGNSGEATIQMVAEAAEEALKQVQTIVRGSSDEPYIKGRVTLFVFPKRYDYGEFAKMVERRGVPSHWTEHWRYDVIDAYVPIVVEPSDDADQVETRLLAPLTSLGVVTRGSDVPRWLAEGLGRAASARLGGRNNEQADRWRERLPDALAAISKPDDFLEGRLTPERADLVAFGIGTQMLQNYRRQTQQLLSSLEDGQDFETAFAGAFRATPQDFITAWQQYQSSPAGARRRSR